MNIDLTGKTAVITGGSRGIGKAVALRLAEAGADIALVYQHQSDYAEQTLHELANTSRKISSFAGDVCLFDQVHQQIQTVCQQFGHIDILVNNAGINKDALLLRMSEAQWDEVICTDLKSAFNYTHACVPVMLRQKQGCIINISSIVGIAGNAGQSNYAAAKAGLIALTKSTALEMGSRNIRVNAIAPGFIQTDMTNQLSEDQQNAILKKTALRRSGTPDEVAKCALFLASDLASYITGQTIICDGGMS